MTLVDQIEHLGAAADAGRISHAEAVQQLVEFSDGGLTHLGAEDLIGRWQSVRVEYRQAFRVSAERPPRTALNDIGP